jgi:chloride channel protein, CIC family
MPVKKKKIRRSPASENGANHSKEASPSGSGDRKNVKGKKEKSVPLSRHQIPGYRNIKTLMTHEFTILSALAAIIGLISALATWGFIRMFQYMRLAFRGVSPTSAFLGNDIAHYPFGYWTILAPALGGLIVGLIIYTFAPEVGGHGIPAVMEAVAVKGGRIRRRVIVVEAISSSISIGSGASVGREGPIVSINAGIGSAFAKWLKLPESWIRILVACGATGGLTAAFNTPIAGVVFALEVILIEFKTRSFIPLVVTAVFTKILAVQLLGDTPAFALSKALLDTYVLKSSWELGLYLLLGFAAGVVAIIFTKSLQGVQEAFASFKTKPYLKTAMGGLFVGLIALLFPQVLGIGYEAVDVILKGGIDMIPFYLIIALIFIKIIATSLSLGSGSSGGMFSPSLFVGAMLGGAFGHLAMVYFPGATGPMGAYAIVGMAAVFAGMTRATFTAIIIVFEMTLDYQLILPVMFACVVANTVSSVLMKESIFTADLAKKGIRIVQDMGVNVIQTMSVYEAMCPAENVVSVRENASIGDVYNNILRTEHHGFPVMDQSEKCIGIITFHDVDKAISIGRIGDPVKWHYTKNPTVTYPDESLEAALVKMDAKNYDNLPVVDRKEPCHLVGFITKGDILRAYSKRSKKDK